MNVILYDSPNSFALELEAQFTGCQDPVRTLVYSHYASIIKGMHFRNANL